MPKARESEKIKIKTIFKMGAIEPTEREWAVPIKFSPKKDIPLRFCVYYRDLNAATVRDFSLKPRMDECIDSLREALVFSTLDASCTCCKFEIDDSHRNEIYFTLNHGLYIFAKFSFGLPNAPCTFHGTMDVIVSLVKWQFAPVFLDDII